METSYNPATEIYHSNKDQMNFTALDYGMAFIVSNEDSSEIDMVEPSSFQEAWNHPDPEQRKKWRGAIRKEFSDMIKYQVWRKIQRNRVPPERRTIGSKWVFKIKRDGRFRARLCGLGYTQIPDVDFTENHAPF